MDFFDKLGKKASETYKATTEKTSKLAKEAKLRLKINENKSAINDLYKEIGKKVYEKHITEEKICIKEILEEECKKIDELSAEIDNDLKEILELKDKKQCPKCFKEIPLEAKFCPGCGEQQEEVVPQEVEVLEAIEDANIASKNENEAEIVKEECAECENNTDEETATREAIETQNEE